jgi:hypothetical protein
MSHEPGGNGESVSSRITTEPSNVEELWRSRLKFEATN